jgi:hypothetical protein
LLKSKITYVSPEAAEGSSSLRRKQPVHSKTTPEERRQLRAGRHARAAERLAERLRKLVDPSADLLAAQERSYNKVYDSASGRRMAPLPVSAHQQQQQLQLRARLKRRSLRSDDGINTNGNETASDIEATSSAAHSPSRSHASSMKSLRFAAAASDPPIAGSEDSDGDVDDTAGDESKATAAAAATTMSQQQRRWRRTSATSEATSISSVQSLLHIVPAVAADTGARTHANAGARIEPPSVTLARNGLVAGSLSSAALPFDHFHVSGGALAHLGADVSSRRRMPTHVRKLSRQLRMQQQREAAIDALRRRRQRRVTGCHDPFDDSSAAAGFDVPDPAAFEGSDHHHSDSAWDSALIADNGSESDDGEDIRRKHRQQRRKSFEVPLQLPNARMQQQQLQQQQHQPPFDNDASADSSRTLMVRAVRVNKPPVFLTEVETEPTPAPVALMAFSSSAQALVVATIRTPQQAPAASIAPQYHVAPLPLPPLLSSMSVPGLANNGRGDGGLSRSLSLNTFARVQSMRALQAAQLADLGSLRARHNMQRALRQEERAQRMALYVGSASNSAAMHVQPAAVAVSAGFGTRRFGPPLRTSATSASATAAALRMDGIGGALAPATVLTRDPSGRLVLAERPVVAAATEMLLVHGSQNARVSSHSAAIASSRSEGQLPLLVAPLTQRERLNPRLAAMTEAAVPLERITAPAWSSLPRAKRFAADKASHIGMGQQQAQAETSGTDHDGDDDDDGDDNASSCILELAARSRRMAVVARRRRQLQRAAVGTEVAKLLIVSNSASLPSLHVQQLHQQHSRQVQLQPSLFMPPLLLPRSHSEQQLLRFPPLSVNAASVSAVAVTGLPLAVSSARTAAHHVRRGYTQRSHGVAPLEYQQISPLQLWGGGAASTRERTLYDPYWLSALKGASLSSRRPLLPLQPHQQQQQRHPLRHRPRGFWEAAAPQRLQPLAALDHLELPFF